MTVGNNKASTVEGPVIRVVRDAQGCCGMKYGEEYEARGDIGAYVSVHLPDGTWTSPHFAPNFFTEVARSALSEGDK